MSLQVLVCHLNKVSYRLKTTSEDIFDLLDIGERETGLESLCIT